MKFGRLLMANLLAFIILSVFLFFLFIGMIVSLATFGKKETVKIKDNSVLYLDFKQPIKDFASMPNPFENLLNMPSFKDLVENQPMNLLSVLQHIKYAATDNNIRGIFLDFKDFNINMANLEEIRNALKEFKKSKKFIVATADVYTQASYYLASVADSIYLTPEGDLTLKGLSAQIMFYKGLLDKLEVEPVVIRHGKFKSAVEPYLLDSMSDANYLQTKTYVSSVWNHLLKGISEERHIPVDSLNAWADSLIITGYRKPLQKHLIDALKYRDQVLSGLAQRLGLSANADINKVSLKTYVKQDIPKPITRNRIAVIYAQGQIDMGNGDNATIGSDRLSKELREAREDSAVKAIVLRINSPGGSALASEIIWREVVLAKLSKPVIVSMGALAASGGYYIASPADLIISNPTTITGSIGVFGLMLNMKKLLNNKLGINVDGYNTNAHSDLGTTYRGLTPYEQKVMQNMVERTYGTFVSHVADGRKMTFAEVDSIGQGRVWTGANAAEIGLVDSIGGLMYALEVAAQRADLDKYWIVEYPKQKSFMQSLLNLNNVQTLFKSKVPFVNDLDENLQYLQNILNRKGVQAILPYVIDWN
jgi:protease-4